MRGTPSPGFAADAFDDAAEFLETLAITDTAWLPGARHVLSNIANGSKDFDCIAADNVVEIKAHDMLSTE